MPGGLANLRRARGASRRQRGAAPAHRLDGPTDCVILVLICADARVAFSSRNGSRVKRRIQTFMQTQERAEVLEMEMAQTRERRAKHSVEVGDLLRADTITAHGIAQSLVRNEVPDARALFEVLELGHALFDRLGKHGGESRMNFDECRLYFEEGLGA